MRGGFCEDCGFDHDDLICRDCGRILFHFIQMRGPVVVPVVVVCPYCDFMDEFPSVQADDEAFAAVEMSLARGSVLPAVVWDPTVLN